MEYGGKRLRIAVLGTLWALSRVIDVKRLFGT